MLSLHVYLGDEGFLSPSCPGLIFSGNFTKLLLKPRLQCTDLCVILGVCPQRPMISHYTSMSCGQT